MVAYINHTIMSNNDTGLTLTSFLATFHSQYYKTVPLKADIGYLF